MATTALERPKQASKPNSAGAGPGLKARAVPWRVFDTPGRIAAWDALAEWAAEPNPFFESWYLLPSLRTLDPHGTVDLLCVEADGVLAGLLPVRRELTYYGKPLPHLRSWVHANCFLGTPLVARGCETLFWRAVTAWCDDHAGSALFLHLPACGLDGPLAAALERTVSRQARAWGTVQREERAVLRSPLSAIRYRQSVLSKRKRADLSRRRRRLAELGDLRTEWADRADGVARWIEDFLALEASGWKGAAKSALDDDPATAALFRQSLSAAAERGKLLRLSLTLDGRPIAMLATFLAEPGAFGFKTAFDESLARHAPGVLLEAEFLSALDRGAFDWCDSCAAGDHALMNALWSERRTVGKLSLAIGGPLRRGLFRHLLRIETGRAAAGAIA